MTRSIVVLFALCLAACGSDRENRENVPVGGGAVLRGQEEPGEGDEDRHDEGEVAGHDNAEAPPPSEPAAVAPTPPAAAGELPPDSPLLHPELATERAPARYTVKLETTKGDITIEVTRGWAPNAADRFYNLVKIGYFDDTAFFRVIGGFMAQIGIHGNPQVNRAWQRANIQDDPFVRGNSNTQGKVTFAQMSMPNSRSTQIFINFGDNSQLDTQPVPFVPFGRVTNMAVVNQIHDGYGEGAPRGRGPDQGRIQAQGNTYLRAEFPELDYIRRATIVGD